MRFRAEPLRHLEAPHSEGLLWVGNSAYPALLESWDIVEPFIAVRRARVHTETPVTLSIIWGCATYSTNHDVFNQPDFQEEPSVVEVGVLNHGALVGDPLGYQNPEQVLALIRLAQQGLVPPEVTQ